MSSVDSQLIPFRTSICTLKLVLFLTLLIVTQSVVASDDDLRIDVNIGAVNAIIAEDNTLWIGTSNGLYKWDDWHRGMPEAVAVQTGPVHVLQRVGNTLWIGSELGVFRWDKPRQGVPQRVDVLTGSVNKLENCGPSLLIGAKGIFIWPNVDAGGNPTHLDLAISHVRTLHQVGSILWIGSDHGLLRWDCESAKQPVFTKFRDAITSLENDGSTLIVGTSRGLFLWNGDDLEEPMQKLDKTEIYSLFKDGSTVLISVKEKGLFRWDNISEGEPQLIDESTLFSSKYYRTGSILWMVAGTSNQAGLFRWDTKQENRPQRLSALNLGYVHAFSESAGTLWIGAENGLFRVDGINTDWVTQINIISRLPRVIYADQNLLVQWKVADFGKRTTPKQVQYKVIVKDANRQTVLPWEFAVVGNPEFILPQLRSGEYILQVQAVDLNGKVATSPPLSFTVYSSGQALLFHWLRIAGAIYVALIVLLIILAPYNGFCHYLLMNPWVRRLGSFGAIPIILSVFPPARHHLLQRYFRGLRKEKDFSEIQETFVIPAEEFLPSTFGTLLLEERKLLLIGQAGIGKTSYFEYLTGYYARNKNTPPSGAIPMFLPLARYEGEVPENVFTAQLSAFGQLSDRELNSWFLQKGGFLIFIDGLNEVDELTRNRISAFVDQHSKTNCFCISSQQPYAEFANIRQVSLASLTEDKILEFLHSRLSDEQVKTIVNQFDGNISEVYKTPHDLQFAVEFKNRNPQSRIPQSLKELYEATLSPILRSWLDDGRTDYPDLLFHRAYTMHCSGETFFDTSDAQLPDDLTGRLAEERYLVRRGSHYLFRHNLVRSFLAAKYFNRRYENILSEDKLDIDDNWREMLKFVLLDLQQPYEAQNLVERILLKNPRLAGDLFAWLTVTCPALSEGWTTDFKIKFADATLTNP